MNSSSEPPEAWLQTLAFQPIVPLLFGTAIGVPSLLLYMAELGVLLAYWSTEYRTPFFILFLLRAVMNILNFIFSFGLYRFGRLGWFTSFFAGLPRFFPAFFYWNSFYTVHAENVATVFMLVNRLTGVLWPTRQKDIWNRFLPWAFAVTLLLPLAVTVHIFWMRVFVHVQADNVTFTIDYEERITGEYVIINDVFAISLGCVIFMLVAFILNVAIIVGYRKTKKMVGGSKTAAGGAGQQQSSSSSLDSIERRLTGYALFTFLGQFVVASYDVLLYVVVFMAPNFGVFDPTTLQLMFLAVWNQMPWVNDLGTLALPAWLLLWAGKHMRQKLTLTVSKATEQMKKSTGLSSSSNKNDSVQILTRGDTQQISHSRG